jgi:BolA protein
MTLIDTITQKLKTDLGATHVEIIDNSWMHAGHAGSASGGSHLAIVVVSPQFEGVPLMERHRRVHQLLKTEMETAIHAMELRVLTPEVWEQERAHAPS